MPPQKRIFQQDILEAAAALVAGQGPQALSVRSLARAMGCSTQPIYSAFESMDALHTALIDYVREHYLRAQASSYKQVAVSFLNFARSQKNLFRLVYLRQRPAGETRFEDPNAPEMNREKAADLHRRMVYYCYSMAVMMATGYLEFSEEEIDRELTEYYRIVLSYYKQVKSEEELQHWLYRSRNLLG